MTHVPVPIFDGHNDCLLRLRQGGGDPVRAFLDGDGTGHLDLPRARAGGFAGGMFAVFVEPVEDGSSAHVNELMKADTYDIPVPPALETAHARRETLAMMALLARIADASQGRVRLCRGIADVRECMATGTLAAVLHLEGADAIDPDLEILDALVAAGVRSIGPVWSRPGPFGDGVPFRFPSSPDIGGGLTDLGKRLVRECRRRRLLVDVSHLTERGFRDVVEIGGAPIVATHSNAHAVCAHSRNLLASQLAAIRESGGLAGINFAATFLRPDGRLDVDTPLDQLLRHLDHLLGRLGEDGVGWGSDFDGATIPKAIGDVAGLPKLVDAMRAHGYGEALIEKVCWRNWLGVLERTWGAPPTG